MTGWGSKWRFRALAWTGPGILLGALASCAAGTLDAGADKPRGSLPVDERNPVVLLNDGYIDNWQGEYALLFANSGVALAGIIVTDAVPWPNIDDNVAGWQRMVIAARESGMRNAPYPIESVGGVLVRPANGDIDSTAPNGSAGARFIVESSLRLSLPYRPLVVALGTRLTDIADAYLLDHTVTDRVVVVASLGSGAPDGGVMGFPNGDMDPWADTIVVQKFRYVQVSAFYNQSADVPSSRLADLPDNAFGRWMTAKQANLWGPTGADQVSVLAAALPPFVAQVQRASQSGGASSSNGPPSLGANPSGDTWLVTQTAGELAGTRMWQMLLSPQTFGH